MHYYFDEAIATSSGQLFNDDGKTNNSIKDEKYELLTFNGTVADQILTIQLICESFFFNIKTEKNVNLILHNCPAIKARIGNKSFKLKSENGLIQIPIKWEIGTDVEILIQM